MSTPIAAVPMLDLKAQWRTLADEAKAAINDVLDSGQFVGGPFHERFEKELAGFCRARHAIAVSSGTDALLVSLMALGIGPGDEVICPPFTFFATASTVARLGARPVFVDICPTCYNLEPGKIEAAITPRTKAIIPVHLFGQIAEMERIAAIAKAHKLAILEDAAQAIGAEHHGKPIGSWGQLTALSFYPTKNLGGVGDGGAVLTQDEALAGKVRILRDHGQNPRYHHHLLGGNFRVDAFQCTVLGVKLKRLAAWNDARRAAAKRYDALLAGLPLKTPTYYPYNLPVVHQYTLRVPGGRRDAVKDALAKANIGHAVFYPIPLHLQPCFAYLGGKAGDCPVAEAACNEVISLPMFAELTAEQQARVADVIRAALAG